MKQKLILLALVMGLTIVSQSSLSLGMGKIQVYSALNEPLQSSIELMANADEELLNLEVTLASSEDYQKVGLDKSFVPANIMVSFDEENPYQINVTSNGPVSEPIVSLLLDVNWSNGRILREFTVLLDPPVYDSTDSNVQVNNVVVEPIQDNSIAEVEVEQPMAVEAESEVQTSDQQTQTITNEDFVEYEQADESNEAEMTADVVEDRPVYSSSSAAEVYVESGDTLWRIANNNKVGELSAQQMMMAIYNKNPSAFINNNINQLIKGSRLDMPSLDEANTIGFSEAMAQVESHHQSWAPAQQDYNSYQTENTVEDDYQAPESSLDYGVQLSGGDNEGSDGGQSNADEGTAADAMAIEEDLYNKEAENTDLKERISELEEIVEQQQDVIEISDDGLANLESQLANTADDVDQNLDEAVDTTTAAADDIWDEMSDAADDEAGTEDSLDLEVDAVDMSAGADSESSQAGELTASDETQAEAVDQADAEVTPVAPKTYTPAEQPSFIDTAIEWVMDNLMWVLIGVVGLVVLLVLPRLLGGSDDDEEEETSFLDDIKNRKRAAEEGDIDAVETKMNQPLVDDNEDDVDSEDDVLAELDRSISFDESETDADDNDLSVNSDDEVTELNAEGEFKDIEDDGFDLDGFLNDDDNDDITATKDHSATLADVSFDDDDNDNDQDHDDDEDDESAAVVDLSDDEDMSLDDFDLNLDDELEDLTEEVEATTEALVDDVKDVSDDVAEEVNDIAEKVQDEADEFSFDDDEEFDFNLDEELEELGQDDEIDQKVTDNDDADADSEDFNDMLDISDEGAETFETVDEEEAGMDEEIDLGLEDLMDDTDAIDTKLDLAKAYMEMGDSEGAKNLLDEIFSEGTEAQIAEAKKLLDDINPSS
jgi:pilus assembly protein FimV